MCFIWHHHRKLRDSGYVYRNVWNYFPSNTGFCLVMSTTTQSCAVNESFFTKSVRILCVYKVTGMYHSSIVSCGRSTTAHGAHVFYSPCDSRGFARAKRQCIDPSEYFLTSAVWMALIKKSLPQLRYFFKPTLKPVFTHRGLNEFRKDTEL